MKVWAQRNPYLATQTQTTLLGANGAQDTETMIHHAERLCRQGQCREASWPWPVTLIDPKSQHVVSVQWAKKPEHNIVVATSLIRGLQLPPSPISRTPANVSWAAAAPVSVTRRRLQAHCKLKRGGVGLRYCVCVCATFRLTRAQVICTDGGARIRRCRAVCIRFQSCHKSSSIPWARFTPMSIAAHEMQSARARLCYGGSNG